ncbi:MAG: DCC1-like thiol-disulfide oxidoreductase family protein, partial [Cyanobacteriota bacterium]|nr:DCC1-like thiol-disulfide oxidoreductase family protein [Cyanobacteriota bacterium]
LFIPFYNSFFRIITIISFILLHIGFELCFDIGVLSYLSIVNWLCLIPSVAWDKAAQRLETSPRKGLEIYYDADCGFCKKVVHFIRTFLILPGTPLLKAQEDAEIYAAMEEQNSWVVRDDRGHHYYKFEGIIYVCSLSPIFGFLTPLLRQSFMRKAGTKMYETIASNRQKAGLLTRPFKFRPLEVKPARFLNIIALFFLLIMFIWNLKGFADQTVARRRRNPKEDWASQVHRLFRRRTVQQIYWLPELTRLDQVWSIFAPSPPLDDGWYAIVGQLKDGSEVNVLQEDQPIPWDKPTIQQRKALYQTIQWRVYYIEMNRAIGQRLYPYLGQYLCRTWNEKHQGKKQLESLEIYYMDERTVPPDEKQTVKKTRVWQQSCSK